MKLTKKQTTALDLLEDPNNGVSEVLFGGGAGGGKSALGCYHVLKSALKFKGSRWILAREEKIALRDTTLNTFWEISKMQGVKSSLRYKEQQGLILVPGGSEILLRGLPWEPSDKDYDYLGSLELTGGFVDEIPQIRQKAWQILKSRVRYKLDEFGLKPKLIGSCNPSKGWTYSYFYKPQRDGVLDSHKAFIQSLYKENPYVDSSYLKTLSELDPISRDRLMNGNWEYDGDPTALMSFDHILDVFKNEYVLPGVRFMSCDIARKGKDKTTIWIWSGWQVIALVVLEKKLTNEVADVIKALARQHRVPMSQIVIDEDGVGGGVRDQVPGSKGFVNNSRALPNPKAQTPEEKKKPENFASLKDQCSYKMASKVTAGEVAARCLSSEQQTMLTEEMEQVKSLDADKDAPLRVVTKDIMKAALARSPDLWDGFMMRAFFEYNPPAGQFHFG